MYNDNKIIGYDAQTGQPIYENQTINQQQTNNIQQQVINNMPQTEVKQNKQSKINKILIITNIITFILMVVFIVAFILKKPNINSSVPSDNIEESRPYISTATTEPVSKDWKKYQFSIKGKTLTLPCSYTEFKDISGFAMKSSDEKSYIERRTSIGVNLYLKNLEEEKLALYIDIKNDSEEDMKYSNTEVVRISQTKSQVQRNNAEKITFPGNLEVGMEMTKEQIIQMFGEANIRDNSDEKYSYLTLTYNDDEIYTTINYYKILLVNGVIDELTLDHKKSK